MNEETLKDLNELLEKSLIRRKINIL